MSQFYLPITKHEIVNLFMGKPGTHLAVIETVMDRAIRHGDRKGAMELHDHLKFVAAQHNEKLEEKKDNRKAQLRKDQPAFFELLPRGERPIFEGELDQLISEIVREWALIEQLAKLNVKPTRFIAFHGDPGNGKTMAAAFLAHNSGLDCYRMIGTQATDAYMGQSSKNIINSLKWANEIGAAVVIDEFDSIAATRHRVNDGADTERNNMVNSILTAFDQGNVPPMLMVTTNYIERIDPAVMRRIGAAIFVGPPSKTACRTIAERNMTHFPWLDEVHRGEIMATVEKTDWKKASDVAGFVQSWVRKTALAKAETEFNKSKEQKATDTNDKFKQLMGRDMKVTIDGGNDGH